MKKIEIFGANCGRCQAMKECARVAATRLGLECEIVNVTLVVGPAMRSYPEKQYTQFARP